MIIRCKLKYGLSISRIKNKLYNLFLDLKSYNQVQGKKTLLIVYTDYKVYFYTSAKLRFRAFEFKTK